MKKALILALAMCLATITLAQAPAGYYSSAEGLTGIELRAALHDIIDGHRVYSYSDIWEIFAYTDCRADGSIWDMYSDLYFPYGNTECSHITMHNEGDCYNREHSWCQSWFGDQKTPRSDMHHIYPVDGVDNSTRNNDPYGEVPHPTSQTANGSKFGLCSLSGQSIRSFEPIDEYKGDIARGLFYMSVRYYGEDAQWGHSAMTNKAEILPWAIEMLLRWSDSDPVSQKELTRNNAVYGFQNNRNPFIDHPEYAHMIWDPDWTGDTYIVTCTTGLVGGSVSVDDYTAYEGQIVSLFATPSPGYALDEWIITDENGNPVSVIQDSFIMPASNVTVAATFVGDPTLYEISCASDLIGGSISTSQSTALSGTTISLISTPDLGYLVRNWYVTESATGNTIPVTNGTFVMPRANVSVTAIFNYFEYQKVTSQPSQWGGCYLIVNEDYSKALNGALTTLDADNNNISITSTDNIIQVDAETSQAFFTIEDLEQGHQSICSASGFYIGNGNDSNLLQSDPQTPLINTITYNNGNFDIVSSGGSYLRYNKANNNNRFRYYKSSTYTYQEPIQLYKLINITATQPYTITFDGNGGALPNSETQYTQFLTYDTPTPLSTCRFDYENHIFLGWTTAEDGSGLFYSDGETISITSDLTLYAQWEPLYPIQLASLSNGTIEADFSIAAEGEIITLTASPLDGFEFSSWAVTDANNLPVVVMDNSFEMPASAVSVSALFHYVGFANQHSYHLVTSADELIEGRKYLIVGISTNHITVMAEQKSNNRAAEEITISDDIITNPLTGREFTLAADNLGWTFYDPIENGYLYAGSNSNNTLHTRTNINDNARWSINIDDTYANAVIVAQGSNSHNTIRYNPSSNLFSCYLSENAQQNVYLFIRSEYYEITSDTLLPIFLAIDKCTVSDSATLTLAEATCDNPSHILIEDGSQLCTPSTNVEVTFRKHVSPYSAQADKWHFIASPFIASFQPNQIFGMLTNNFDLYGFDQTCSQWLNHKENPLTIHNGDGYLYANAQATTIEFTGIVQPTSNNHTIYLDYDANAPLPGFNLVGNPYPCNANIGSIPFYICNGDEIILSQSTTIPPCTGIMVQAIADQQPLTFYPGNVQANALQLEVSRENITLDRAQLSFNPDSTPLEKLTLKKQTTRLYIHTDNTNYAAYNVSTDAQAKISINFEPIEDGTYTLSITLPTQDSCDYLHLIDKLTGDDIDLLETDTPIVSYVFRSSISDNPSRFELIFNSQF